MWRAVASRRPRSAANAPAERPWGGIRWLIASTDRLGASAAEADAAVDESRPPAAADSGDHGGAAAGAAALGSAPSGG